MHKIILFFLFVLTSSLSLAHATPLPVKKPDTIKPVTQTSSPVSITKNFNKSDHLRPLTQNQIKIYKDVMALQDAARWDEARTVIEKIKNPVLLDYIQSRQTGAPLKRKSSKIQGTLDDLRYFARGSKYISEQYKSGERYELNLVKKELRKNLDRGAISAALSFFNNHRVQSYIDPIDKSQILAEIASHYLYLKRYDRARSTALRAIKSSDKAPLAGWVMGLTAWMRDDMAEATKYFTIATDAPYASPWMTSAASYWGARAATRARLFEQVSPLLSKAVKNQRTFYGLIATKALGYGYDFNWTMPEYTPQHRDILMTHLSGARALAFIELGQLNLAEQELFSLPVKGKADMAEAAIALANHYNLAGYAMRFSSAIPNPAGGYYDAGLFPLSTWTKKIDNSDRALLNAFIRQESRFVTGARNGTGATGLMQIMPNTAAYITENGLYKTDAGRQALSRPRNNVEIGAKYLNHLLSLEAVNRDLFGLAIAYNAGPGNLRKWKNDLKVDDPLLFIELIPASETRAFVERVLTNYWVYQMQLGIEPDTLKDVAQGDWPRVD